MRAVDHALAELAEALSWRSAGLTEREVDVLRLVAIGLSNDDIARAPSGVREAGCLDADCGSS
jgi:ATP/maltotriose-dependent transcriptional regulator MalT